MGIFREGAGQYIMMMRNDDNPIKIGEWYQSELNEASKEGFELGNYEFIKYVPGLSDRGVKSACPTVNGYELYFNIKK
jgi:hypothetical protein